MVRADVLFDKTVKKNVKELEKGDIILCDYNDFGDCEIVIVEYVTDYSLEDDGYYTITGFCVTTERGYINFIKPDTMFDVIGKEL